MAQSEIYNPFEAIERRLAYLESQLGVKQDKTLLTINETAERFGIAKTTLYKWTHERYIPHMKVGRYVYFNPDELQEWFAGKGRLTVKQRGAQLRNH